MLTGNQRYQPDGARGVPSNRLANTLVSTQVSAQVSAPARAFTSSSRALGSFVPKIARKAFEKYGFASSQIMTDWETIVGRDLAAYCKPERLKWPRGPAAGEDGLEQDGRHAGATLVVRVEPARALDIQYGAERLMSRINSYFGYQAVARLQIIQWISPVNPGDEDAAQRPAKPSGEVPAPPAVLSALADTPLKATLEALWLSVAAAR